MGWEVGPPDSTTAQPVGNSATAREAPVDNSNREVNWQMVFTHQPATNSIPYRSTITSGLSSGAGALV